MNLLPTDEINALRTKVESILIDLQIGVKTKKQAKKEICDDLLELLLIAYTYGCEDVNEMLGTQIAPTYDEMRESIYRKIAGEDFEQRVGQYIQEFSDAMEYADEHATTAPGEEIPKVPTPPLSDIMRIADTDSHRVYNEAGYTTAKQGGATTKKWVCHFHNSRDTHIYLHDTEVPIDAEFYTFLGNHAMFPGEFGVAYEDCNCECTVEYRK